MNIRLKVLVVLSSVAGLAQQAAVNCHEALAGYRENRTPFELVRASCPPEVTADVASAGLGAPASPPIAPGRVIDIPTLAVLSRTMPDAELVAEIGRAQAVNIDAAQLAAVESSFSKPVIAALRSRLGSSAIHRSPAVSPVVPAEAPPRVTAPGGASVIVGGQQIALAESVLLTSFTDNESGTLSEDVKNGATKTAAQIATHDAMVRAGTAVYKTVGPRLGTAILLGAGNVGMARARRGGYQPESRTGFQMYFLDGVSANQTVNQTPRFVLPSQYVAGHEIILLKAEPRPNQQARLLDSQFVEIRRIDQFGQQRWIPRLLRAERTVVPIQSAANATGLDVWPTATLSAGEYAFVFKNAGSSPDQYSKTAFSFRVQ